jgi:hypothetical protein
MWRCVGHTFSLDTGRVGGKGDGSGFAVVDGGGDEDGGDGEDQSHKKEPATRIPTYVDQHLDPRELDGRVNHLPPHEEVAEGAADEPEMRSIVVDGGGAVMLLLDLSGSMFGQLDSAK